MGLNIFLNGLFPKVTKKWEPGKTKCNNFLNGQYLLNQYVCLHIGDTNKGYIWISSHIALSRTTDKL